jgi:hypothetical protein
MATKKTSKAKGAAAKKAVAKKTPAKKSEGKKVAAKKATPKKTAKADAGCAFHLYDEGQKKFVPAEQAKAVKIDGFDMFSFFLHKSADGNGWTISEATSGARIAVGRTQAEVKAKAAEALSKHGAADLAESIRRTIAKNGAAPGYETAGKAAKPGTRSFKVTTDDGETVDVTFDAEFRNHLEFRGAISPTGYRSHFGYDGKGKVEDAARKIANALRAEFLKEQVKQARKGKKGAEPQKAPQVTTRLKSRILAALVDDKKLPRLQVQFDKIVKATGAPVGDVAAALMVLELNRAVKSLPGKFYRLPKADEEKGKGGKGNRGGKPQGKMSMLDAAVEILKGTKEPITVKEITRAIFEKELAASNGRTPHATLSAAMGREIAGKGAQSRFRRADRGRFELNA